MPAHAPHVHWPRRIHLASSAILAVCACALILPSFATAAATLGEPADTAVLTGLARPTFTFTPGAGETDARVYVSQGAAPVRTATGYFDDEFDSSLLAPEGTPDTAPYTAADVYLAGTYSWMVMSTDADYNNVVSPVRTFTVAPTASVSFVKAHLDRNGTIRYRYAIGTNQSGAREIIQILVGRKVIKRSKSSTFVNRYNPAQSTRSGALYCFFCARYPKGSKITVKVTETAGAVTMTKSATFRVK